MNVASAYGYVRAYLLALVLWATLWIAILVAISPPGSATAFGAFGLFVSCIFFGIGLFGVCYLALQAIKSLGWPRPVSDAVLWAVVPPVVLSVVRFGEWDEALAGALAGVIAGCGFWLFSRNTAPSAPYKDRGPLSAEEMAQLKPLFHRDPRSDQKE